MTETKNRFHEDFLRLYPEVDPTTPLSINRVEKVSIAVATAVCAYGIGFGNIPIAFFGALLIIFAAVSCGFNPRRRVRNTARTRFPQEPWAEYATSRGLHLRILFPIFWLAIGLVAIGCLYLVPAEHAQAGGIGAAIFAVIATWFMPGLSTVWDRNDSEKSQPIDASAQSRASQNTTRSGLRPAPQAAPADPDTTEIPTVR
ncbi:MAG: hypothetical protein Q3972_01045 [Corynebacterium sp.]|nr:hypothetical protein [Corynebacterium sp.]